MRTSSTTRRSLSISLSAIALTSIAFLYGAPASATGSSSSTPVTLYQHVNFRGRSLSVGEGVTSFRTIRRSRVRNDRISSIRIEPGYEVLACEHARFRGRCEVFTNDTADLRDINFNDIISSVKVQLITNQPVPVNNPPVASPASAATDADTPVTINLLAIDLDSDDLSFSVEGNDITGSTFTYDPTISFATLPLGETRLVTLEYTVSDGQATATSTITITVTGTFVPATPSYALGDVGPGGGIVFQINDDGTSGLEYAPDILRGLDELGLSWGCHGLSVDGTNIDNGSNGLGENVKTGAESSALLSNALDNGICTSPAAAAAFNYETGTANDWYLPSTIELLSIRDSVVDGIELPGGSGTPYWSSTEDGDFSSFLVLIQSQTNPLDNGRPSTSDKNKPANILPIRSF